MKRDDAKRVIVTHVGWILAAMTAAPTGCDRAPAVKGSLVTGKQTELEPRPIVPDAQDVVSIRIQADQGFLGGPLDQTFEAEPAIADILKIVQVIRTGPREIGDVAKHGKKGQMTIRTKTGLPLELRLSDERAIHFVSAFSIDTDRLAEVVKKHRKDKQ
jgi:hypothetical protein